MIQRLAARVLLALLTLFLSTLLLYLAIRLVPGTPWGLDDATPPERIARWIERHHLDRGFLPGYFLWLEQVLRGDLGSSYTLGAGRDVRDLIASALPVSVLLGTLGFGASLVVSVLLGLVAAHRPGGPADRTGSAVLFLLNAAPSFWIALLARDLFAVRLAWLPPMGTGPLDRAEMGLIESASASLPYWVLPPACLALGSMAFFFRFSRAGLLEAARSGHVGAARARGLPEALVLGRHALAATSMQLVTLMGLLAPAVIGGSVIIERVFALPGIGWLFFEATSLRDYPVVMGVGLVMAAVTIAASAAADILYTVAEPRLRKDTERRP